MIHEHYSYTSRQPRHFIYVNHAWVMMGSELMKSTPAAYVDPIQATLTVPALVDARASNCVSVADESARSQLLN